MDAVVTGGAGFIGSHVADALLERGERVAVIDNLAGGRRDRVPAGAEFHELDIRDRDAMQAVFDDAAAGGGVPPGRPGRRARVGRGPRPRRRRERARHDRGARVPPAAPARGWCSRPPAARSTATPTRSPRRRRRRAGADVAVRHLQVLRRAVPGPVQPALRHAPRDAALRQRVRPAPGSARRGGRGRDLLRQADVGRDAADLRRRPPDARLRATWATWWRPTWRRSPTTGPQPGLQHRHPDRDRRGRPAGRVRSGWPAPTSHPSTGRRGWESSTAAASTLAGAARAGLAAGDARSGRAWRETLRALHP